MPLQLILLTPTSIWVNFSHTVSNKFLGEVRLPFSHKSTQWLHPTETKAIKMCAARTENEHQLSMVDVNECPIFTVESAFISPTFDCWLSTTLKPNLWLRGRFEFTWKRSAITQMSRRWWPIQHCYNNNEDNYTYSLALIKRCDVREGSCNKNTSNITSHIIRLQFNQSQNTASIKYHGWG